MTRFASNFILCIYFGSVVLYSIEARQKIKIVGPNEVLGENEILVFRGDLVKFLCSVNLTNEIDFNAWSLHWTFTLINGDVLPEIHVASNKDDISKMDSHLVRTSYLKIPHHKYLDGIMCTAKENNVTIENESRKLKVQPVVAIHQMAIEDICPYAERKPKIVLRRYSEDLEDTHWSPHDVTDATIALPSSVVGFKITCLYKTMPFLHFVREEKPINTKLIPNAKQPQKCFETSIHLPQILNSSQVTYYCNGNENFTLQENQMMLPNQSTVVIIVPNPPTPSNALKILEEGDLQLLEFLHQLLVDAVCPDGSGKGPLYGISTMIFFILILVFYYSRRKMNLLKLENEKLRNRTQALEETDQDL